VRKLIEYETLKPIDEKESVIGGFVKKEGKNENYGKMCKR